MQCLVNNLSMFSKQMGADKIKMMGSKEDKIMKKLFIFEFQFKNLREIST